MKLKKQEWHGQTGTPTYYSWADMLKRCRNPKTRKWHRYGGRGITVCKRWLTFGNFLADMGERPTGTTIDRYPNKDGNYKKSNCRWATSKQQGNNTSTNMYVSFEGKKMTAQEAADILGLKGCTLRIRLHRQKRTEVSWNDAKLTKRENGLVTILRREQYTLRK